MPKIAKALSALEVNRLTRPGFHAVGTVAGLHLKVQPSGARSWIMRVKVEALRRDVGLGAYPGVTLAGAWEKARAVREDIAGGTDPVNKRRANRSAIKAEQTKAITFQKATEQHIAALAAGWKSTKHKQQWENTLSAYADPVIGQLLVRDIAQAHILEILEPIWTTKTETATRVRGRIEKVLDWAKGRGLRTGDNPAAWKGILDVAVRAGMGESDPNWIWLLPVLLRQVPAAAMRIEFEALSGALVKGTPGPAKGPGQDDDNLESIVAMMTAMRGELQKFPRRLSETLKPVVAEAVVDSLEAAPGRVKVELDDAKLLAAAREAFTSIYVLAAIGLGAFSTVAAFIIGSKFG